MNDIKTRANDFSKGSILKHILRLAIPMTIAQLITILYNIVDRMFIGRIGGVETTDALTGVGSLPSHRYNYNGFFKSDRRRSRAAHIN